MTLNHEPTEVKVTTRHNINFYGAEMDIIWKKY
jgi:hypothetical protein